MVKSKKQSRGKQVKKPPEGKQPRKKEKKAVTSGGKKSVAKPGRFSEILAGSKFSPLNLFTKGEIGGWWDSSDRLTVLADEQAKIKSVTEAVGHWKDKSPNQNDLKQTAPHAKPKWYGLEGIRFDGIDDYLFRNGSIGLYAAGACTLFVVLKATPSTDRVLISETSSSSEYPRYHVVRNSAGTAASANAFISNDERETLHPPAGLAANVFDGVRHVYCVVDDSIGITPYLDGMARKQRSYDRRGPVTVDRFALGAQLRAFPSNFFAADLYELIIVGRVLSDQERDDCTSHLKEKWSIPG